MDKIKVMIVDDQALIREGLKMMLSLSSEIEVMMEASNGKEAFESLKQEKPDVILMDIRMPVMDGVESIKLIKDIYPQIKIIILTTFNEDEYIFEGLKNGADGYILKDIKSDEIIKGIKSVYQGNTLLQPEIANKVVKAFKNFDEPSHKKEDTLIIRGKYENLTPREVEISILVSKGKSNKEISKALYITEGTVKNYLTKILAKLELENRTQLAVYINEKSYD